MLFASTDCHSTGHSARSCAQIASILHHSRCPDGPALHSRSVHLRAEPHQEHQLVAARLHQALALRLARRPTAAFAERSESHSHHHNGAEYPGFQLGHADPFRLQYPKYLLVLSLSVYVCLSWRPSLAKEYLNAGTHSLSASQLKELPVSFSRKLSNNKSQYHIRAETHILYP